MPGTVTLHRVYTCPPEKIYRAFGDAEALAQWIPPDGFACTVQEMDFRVGGSYKASFTNFTTGKKEHFGGTHNELIPGERLCYVDRFADPNMPGEMTVTVQLKKVMNGTDFTVVQKGIPDMIPLEFCYVGWQQSLDHLAKLVEPNIPDAG